jgi:sulfonate transport system substrate-binding protein
MLIRWFSYLKHNTWTHHTWSQLLSHLKRRFRATFILLFGTGLCASLLFSACNAGNSPAPNTTSAATTSPTSAQERVVRVGYMKSGVLFLVKHRGGLEKRLKPLNVDVKWHEFVSSTPLIEALAAESIDLGQSSDAGTVSAQAGGLDVVTIANSRPSPKSVAIVVSKDSPIQKVADLKGKKVAFNRNTAAQTIVVQALTTAGLKYEDIQPVFLQPPEGRVAFERGSVDAWAIWDPFLAAAQRKANARILVDGEGVAPFREFYLASRQFTEKNPTLVKQIIAEAQDVGDWAMKHPKEVAKFLAPYMKLDVQTMELAESRRTRYGAQPIQPEALAEQQKIADAFSQVKLIPKPVEVADAAWSPKQ